MAVEILDPRDKGLGVLHLIRCVIAHDNIVSRAQHFIRYSEVESKLLVCQNDVIRLVHHQNAINGRLSLRLQQRIFEQQGFLSLFAFRDVAHRGQQPRLPAQGQCRQADLSRKNISVLALVQPLETFRAIDKRGGNLSFGRRAGVRAVGLVRG